MTLLRTALGYAIRTERTDKNLTLRAVAQRAPLALGYLSEVERGQKDISSELLNSVSRGLDMKTSDLLLRAYDILADWEQQEKENETTHQNKCLTLS